MCLNHQGQRAHGRCSTAARIQNLGFATLPRLWQAQNLGDAGPAVASPSTSRPDGAHAAGTAGEAGGKKRKKRRREGAAAEGAAGASPEGRSHDAAGAAGFRAPSSLAAGNPFAALMREPTTARKKA